MQPNDRICLACDGLSAAEVLGLAKELKGIVSWYKVHTLVLTYGPRIVRSLRKLGVRVFLDMKFHDIPNTVAAHSRAATLLGADMFTVHASGGTKMMQAAKQASAKAARAHGLQLPKVLGVTVLTSLDADALAETGISCRPLEQVERLAGLAKKAGLDGIVCSAQELGVSQKLPPGFLFVTPGISMKGMYADQKRVTSPSDAVRRGASLIVVGRAVLGEKDRRTAAQRVFAEVSSAETRS